MEQIKKKSGNEGGMRGSLVGTGRESNWQDFPMNEGKNHTPDDGGSVLKGIYRDKHLCFQCMFSTVCSPSLTI